MKINFRHIILAFALAVLGIAPAFAQKGFNAGINGGYLASATIDRVKFGDVPYNLKWKTGPTYGIAVGYNFTDKLGLEVEANYLSLGAKYDVNDNNTLKYFRSFDINYYQIPILFKFTGGNFLNRFSSMVGPAFGFLNSAQMHNDAGVVSDVTSQFKSTDAGLLLAAGGDVTITHNLYLNIALRFYYGFYTINNNPQAIVDLSTENEKLANAYIGVNLGLYNMFVKTPEAKPLTW
jgi:opacity protein-like surface antigen